MKSLRARGRGRRRLERAADRMTELRQRRSASLERPRALLTADGEGVPPGRGRSDPSRRKGQEAAPHR